MKILYLCQLYPPLLYGGGEYIFYEWAKELVKKGNECFVITQRIEGTKEREVIDGINVIRVGPKITYKGALYSIGAFGNFGYFLNSFFKGMKIVKEQKIDIIHSNTFLPAFSGYLISKLTKIPHIVTVHDVYLLQQKEFWKKWSSQPEVSFLVSKLGPLIEKLILNMKYSAIHTVSKTSKRDILKVSKKNKVIIVPNGIDLKKYDEIKSKKKKNQFIYIGRHVFYKNLETVIRAMALVANKIPDAKLIVVGDGPMRNKWENLARYLKLENNISFVGRVSHQEKVKLLKESQFLVMPSLIEGFGIVVIEAFACKIPVIASNVMPLPELVKDEENGYLVPPFGIKEWYEKIIKLLENEKLCERMGKKGRKLVEENYTIQKIAEDVLKMYNKVIK